MAHVLGPNKCHRGEQLGLKLHLHNHDRNRMLVIATLLGSPDYRFINVERDGIVSSYDARSTSGDHQILIYVIYLLYIFSLLSHLKIFEIIFLSPDARRI